MGQVKHDINRPSWRVDSSPSDLEKQSARMTGRAIGPEPPHTGKAELRRASSQVVSEYLAGCYPALVPCDSEAVRTLLLNELLVRCPGFSTREYRLALTARLVTREVVPQMRNALAHSSPNIRRKRRDSESARSLGSRRKSCAPKRRR